MVAVFAPIKHRATYHDLTALPDDVLGQIVGGELYATPRPAMPHTFAASDLFGALHGPFRKGAGGPGGWWLLFEPELHLGSDVVVPDVAGWRQERMPTRATTAAIELAPDWLCEILAPSTVYIDRGPKMQLYAHVGVPHVWLVDPIARTLEVMRLRDGTWSVIAVHGGTDKVRAEPFGAVELDLADWWGSDPDGKP